MAPGETISLDKVIGASCTLVISHQQNLAGKTYASIDADSKPTKKVTASGTYNGAAARQRYADWCLRTATMKQAGPAPSAAAPVATPQASSPVAPAPVKSDAGATRTGQPAAPDSDPEVGF